MSPLPVSTVMKLVSSVPYSISYCGVPLGSLGGSQLSSKPSERMRVTDSSRGTEGTVHVKWNGVIVELATVQMIGHTYLQLVTDRSRVIYCVYAGNLFTCVQQ